MDHYHVSFSVYRHLEKVVGGSPSLERLKEGCGTREDVEYAAAVLRRGGDNDAAASLLAGDLPGCENLVCDEKVQAGEGRFQLCKSPRHPASQKLIAHDLERVLRKALKLTAEHKDHIAAASLTAAVEHAIQRLHHHCPRCASRMDQQRRAEAAVEARLDARRPAAARKPTEREDAPKLGQRPAPAKGRTYRR